jgi:DNA excision repair protein ERCC-8
MLTFGTDDHMRLWDSQTGRNLNVNYGRIDNSVKKKLEFSTSAGCSPELAYVPADSNVNVYDIFNGNRVSVLRGHYTQVNSCYFDQEKRVPLFRSLPLIEAYLPRY